MYVFACIGMAGFMFFLIRSCMQDQEVHTLKEREKYLEEFLKRNSQQ